MVEFQRVSTDVGPNSAYVTLKVRNCPHSGHVSGRGSCSVALALGRKVTPKDERTLDLLTDFNQSIGSRTANFCPGPVIHRGCRELLSGVLCTILFIQMRYIPF